ncbi:hypothetical protein JCM18237_22920 [Halorubrum luteum]
MPRKGKITEDVVSAVADREGVSQDALPPLYEYVETDALEQLFEHATTGPDADLFVRFSYAGYRVTVQEPGDVSIDER